ncbi:hypothetical protein FRB96_007689 [Tulasnella sp. 330]|nr:hypothetical protein FRB96_007689 [Tulasnella sp. 330]
MSQSQTVEEATVQLSPVTESMSLPGVPDGKTRRYDRQLRLWAASGQNALEAAHILVLGASPTSTSILKNLVLPGIGAFTILDDGIVGGRDLGANFFFETTSLGKNKAKEAVMLLCELNDGVAGHADDRSLQQVLSEDPTYFNEFSLVIAHNIPQPLLEQVSTLLWEREVAAPLFVVRTSGFLADFGIQFKEHTVITSHSETAPSLRIDKPFSALLAHAFSLNFEGMDPTEHAHIPYVVILVRCLQEWKNDHAGNPPKTPADKKAFKERIMKMKKKDDEENFDEAYMLAYKAWTVTSVPSEIEALLNDPQTKNLNAKSDPFWHLVHALNLYVSQPPHVLPLSATLPDMKSDTKSYIHLQNLYKTQADEDKARFTDLLRGIEAGWAGGGAEGMDGVERSSAAEAMTMIDDFVKNAHGLKVLRGKKWLEQEDIAPSITASPSSLATHLALSALVHFEAQNSRLPKAADVPDAIIMTDWVREKLTGVGWKHEEKSAGGEDTDMTEGEEEDAFREIPLWEHVENAVGEVSRAPAAELPTTAALMGGIVAQEVIKVVTKHHYNPFMANGVLGYFILGNEPNNQAQGFIPLEEEWNIANLMDNIGYMRPDMGGDAFQ